MILFTDNTCITRYFMIHAQLQYNDTITINRKVYFKSDYSLKLILKSISIMIYISNIRPENTLHMIWSFCRLLCHKDIFLKKSSGIPSMSNSLDPDQARQFVGPDLGQTVYKGTQQTTKITTSRERVNIYWELNLVKYIWYLCQEQ